MVTSLALDKSILTTPATAGAFGRQLAENTATGPITAPLLLAQGGADALVLPAVQKGIRGHALR